MEKKYNRVLVPIDFSADSVAAIQRAMTLAIPKDITILHVLDRGSVAMPGDLHHLSNQDELKEKIAVGLEDLCRDANLPDELVKRVETGNPAETICEVAKGDAFELIVLPRHGQSRIQKFLLGSVASRVVEAATCPVLVLQPAV